MKTFSFGEWVVSIDTKAKGKTDITFTHKLNNQLSFTFSNKNKSLKLKSINAFLNHLSKGNIFGDDIFVDGEMVQPVAEEEAPREED